MSFSIGQTPDERQKAAQAAPHIGRQKGVQIDQDALASAALIYGAIDKLPDDLEIGPIGSRLKVKQLMIDLATKLSHNTLVPWYKGAALLIGDFDQIKSAFSTMKPDGSLEVADANFLNQWWVKGKQSNADDKKNLDNATEALRALRRTYGNGWEGSVAVGTALETQQLKKERDHYWNSLPGSTYADGAAGVGMPMGS